MFLLNATALLGLSALLIPILLHLQKRRKPKEVAWAAMRFLKQSLVARHRGLTLENLLLLFCRCLLLALFVLAMARPLMGAGFNLRAILMLLFGVAAVLATTFAIIWHARRGKIMAAMLAVILLIGAAWSCSVPQGGLLAGPENCDLAIVLDGTLSMTLAENGKTRFENAIAEAQALVDQLSGKSTATIVLAGPVPQVVEDSPFRNLASARAELAKLQPVGGGANLQDAIARAKLLLEKGTNQNKQVIVFSDDQLAAWQQAAEGANPATTATDSSATDSQDADKSRESNAIPVYGRLAKLPKEVDNLAVVDVRVDSVLPTTQAPLTIEIEVQNGGTQTIHRRSLKLLIDDQEVATQPIPQLEPGARTKLRFVRKINAAGQHLISGVIPEADMLTADNRRDLVLSVISQVSVLVIDGNPSPELAQHSATFSSLALDPTVLRRLASGPDNAATESTRPIHVERITLAALAKLDDLSPFQIVLLCDANHLSDDVAQRLSKFTSDGGGLWVIPSSTADVEAYNRWSKPNSEERLLPGELQKTFQTVQPVAEGKPSIPVGINLNAVTQSPLSRLVQRGEHDLTELSVLTYWQVEPGPNAATTAQLTNGAPLMLEHTVGRGRVVLQTLPLDRSASNLISLVSFPVMMHLWVQRMVASDLTELNFHASPHLTLELPPADLNRPSAITNANGALPTAAKSTAANTEPQIMKLKTPAGDSREVPVLPVNSRQTADMGLVCVPGVYRLQRGEQSLPFTVDRDAQESDLTAASPQKLKQLGERLGIVWMDTLYDLQRRTTRSQSGHELWQVLMYVTLCLLALEAVLARWVTRRRALQSATSSAVTIAADPLSTSSTSPSHPGPGPGRKSWQAAGPFRPVGEAAP